MYRSLYVAPYCGAAGRGATCGRPKPGMLGFSLARTLAGCVVRCGNCVGYVRLAVGGFSVFRRVLCFHNFDDGDGDVVCVCVCCADLDGRSVGGRGVGGGA